MTRTTPFTQFFCMMSFLLALLLVGCSTHPDIRVGPRDDSLSELTSELDRVFSRPEFANAYWGVVIRSLDTGKYWYLRNENKGFMPASNMKLFTTAAALVELGPDFRFETRLLSRGSVQDSVLKGDLIIQGGGDPSLGGRYYDDRITHVFEVWADTLASRGIHRVEGDIVANDRFFQDDIMGAGWSWDYQSDYYAAQISALSFNDNCIDLIFTPSDSVGGLTVVQKEPSTDYVSVINRVVTVDSTAHTQVVLERQRGTNTIVCIGTVPVGVEPVRDWVTVEDPALFAATVFREALQTNGINVSGKTRVDTTDLKTVEDVSLQALHQSPPLDTIVYTINKISQNLYAELLLRTLGHIEGGEGTARRGARVEKELFADMGINPEWLVIADGSGLSRKNQITPFSLVQLLSYMHHHVYGDVFYKSLPIAGEDGTISKRMIGTSAQHNVRAKTGYIDRARALSGYVTTRDGEELAFSMIVNNYTVPTSLANHFQDTVCERLANYSRDR